LPISPSPDEQGIAVLRRNVGPPVPWRDADLPREIVRAKRGGAPVAAGNHQRLLNAGERVGNHHHEKALPLAPDLIGIQLAAANQRVDNGAMSQRSDEDRVRRQTRGVLLDPRLQPRDALDIGSQIAGRDVRHLVIFRGHEQVRSRALIHEFEITRGRLTRRHPGQTQPSTEEQRAFRGAGLQGYPLGPAGW
jgi:hypothetical protein